MKMPKEYAAILAKIEHIDDLGISSWYEVVYFNKIWHSYEGSNTFQNGEKVVKWKYCEDIDFLKNSLI